jgi:iron complex outermembrane receptor protein
MLIGNPDLDQTTNNEIDFGLDTRYGQSHVKTRLFYSNLDNFIHYNASKTMRRFDNVDATIYGIDISGSYVSSPRTSIDYGLAWQHGSKNEALDGQTDRDLAEIPPLKARMAFNYKYRENNDAQVEFVAADSWNNYDADNGEQKLDSWGVINVKVNHHFSRQLGLTVGIDNLFDETYAVSNTYNDLTLLSDGTGDVMLINEPGRYLYMNAVYSF